MSVLSWGKCKIEHTTSIAGAVPAGAGWRQLDTPKENTTKVTPTAGTAKEAREEGGGLVDYKAVKNTYLLEFDIFVKKGQAAPFSDEDGVVAGEHAFRITPEDESCEGCLMERTSLRVDVSFSTDEGKMLHHSAQGLKPASGNTVKPYVANGLTLSKNELFFGNAADNTGKQVTVTATDAVSATSDQSWCTVTVAGTTVTVKVAAHSGSEARVAHVTVCAGSSAGIVTVTQIPA